MAGFGRGAGFGSGAGHDNPFAALLSQINNMREFVAPGPASGPASGSAPKTMRKGRDSHYDLAIPLAGFYSGVTKRIKLSYPEDPVKTSIVEVNVMRGWRSGVKLTFENKAWNADDGSFGDLRVTLNEVNDTLFKRKVDVNPDPMDTRDDRFRFADLVYDMIISMIEAESGFDKTIIHLDGHAVQIGSSKLHKTGDVIVVPNEGMPIRSNGEVVGHGSLFVQLIVA